MLETVAQIVGFLGTALLFISFQQKKRQGILFFQICSGAVFILHYILLGALTGAALNFIGFSRSIVFYNSDKKWAKSPWWLVFFIIISGIASAATWAKWYSILPAIAMMLTTVSYWLKNETKIRLVTFPSSPCWLVYNALAGSVAGVITECIVMSSLVIAIIRFDILKKGKKVNEN